MKNAAILAVASSLAAFPIAASAAALSPQQFTEKAAQSDMFELAAAKLVVEKGKSEKVNAFASDMLADYGESTKHLKEAAAKDGVSLPAAMGPELQKKLEALKPLTGVQLDAAYVSTQVSVHTDAVALFENYSKDGEGGALKSFAEATYPTIRMHLIRIQGFNTEQ
jgi:putative membrane protein